MSREAQPTTPSGARRLLSLARHEALFLTLGTLALLVASGTGLATPALVGHLVDGITEGAGRDALDRAALLLLGLFAISGVSSALRSYLFTVAGERLVARLRANLYEAVLRREIGFFDARQTGELTNRLASDTTVLQNAVTVNISMALRFAVQALGAICILLWINWRLCLVMLAVVPVVAAIAGFYGSKLRKISRKVQDALARASEVAEETLAGVRTVRAFAQEEREINRYTEAVDESFRLAQHRAALGAGLTGGVSFAGYSAIAAVLWYGGVLLSEGLLSFGDLTSFLLYTFTVAFSVGALSGLWADFAKSIGASQRVFELLDEGQHTAQGGDELPSVRGHVALHDVRFAYPTRPEAPVLDGVSLTLEPGEVVALVGPSGGGKSTIAALLCRLYDPTAGHLALDGSLYNTLDPSWLRRQVGVVRQEPILFATTVAENIRYGRSAASDAEVYAAAEAANAHTFVEAFPEGYATRVGERGVRLSGGQKQRVAIARALLKDPSILVLDEATSALDTESEHLVQEALEHLMRGRTTLVIAHRLSTVRDANRVLVVDEGRIVEMGTHETLLERGGLYQKLVKRQFTD